MATLVENGLKLVKQFINTKFNTVWANFKVVSKTSKTQKKIFLQNKTFKALSKTISETVSKQCSKS